MTSALGSLAARDGYPHARARQDRLAGWLALAGASLGALAGLLELTIGPSIRDWVGNKQDTTRLGWTTIILSLVALAAAIAIRRRPDRRVAIALGLLVPGLICFTTVGRLWYLPGTLLWSARAADFMRTSMQKLPRQKIFQEMTVRNVNTTRKLHALLQAMSANHNVNK